MIVKKDIHSCLLLFLTSSTGPKIKNMARQFKCCAVSQYETSVLLMNVAFLQRQREFITPIICSAFYISMLAMITPVSLTIIMIRITERECNVRQCNVFQKIFVLPVLPFIFQCWSGLMTHDDSGLLDHHDRDNRVGVAAASQRVNLLYKGGQQSPTGLLLYYSTCMLYAIRTY